MFGILEGWLAYEILVGLLAIKSEHFCEGKKHTYVPPNLLHAKAREKYLEWKEWKGDRFK